MPGQEDHRDALHVAFRSRFPGFAPAPEALVAHALSDPRLAVKKATREPPYSLVVAFEDDPDRPVVPRLLIRMTADTQVLIERVRLELSLMAMSRAWQARFRHPLRAHREHKRAEKLGDISVFRQGETEMVAIYRPGLCAIADEFDGAGREQELRDLATWADRLIQHEQDEFARNPPPNRRARFIERDGEVSEDEVRAFKATSAEAWSDGR